MPASIIRLSLFVALLLSFSSLYAQDINLASQYFADGEYEKAASIYEKLAEREEVNEYYFNRYIECLANLDQYETAETAIKKRIRKFPSNVVYFVQYGSLLDRQGKADAAAVQYKNAIEKVSPDFASISRLATTFTSAAKYDQAIATYEYGNKILNAPGRFAFNLGELYRRKGDVSRMITYYLDALNDDHARLGTIEALLARYLSGADLNELQKQLYERIQKDESLQYVELLAWSFVQRRDFKSALRQYKALDRRLSENGNRVMNLANDAADSRDYETAIAAYDYIVTEKGMDSPYFFEAKREAMNTRRKKITEGISYTKEDLAALETEYEQFLTTHANDRRAAEIILELSDLEAFYINNLPKAIQLLADLLKSPGLDPKEIARVKINLGDFYLMNGDIWESTLLYSQVDKAFREDPSGQEARFKNARLSYFNGDFQWAQAQFDVLKASTSKLISNDALDLSVFIMDNLNMDTTAEAVSLYSAAELLVLQNRFDEAFLKLDTLRRQFPEHSLQDDILYLEAQIYEKKREYIKAAELYQQVADKFSEDIRADNSLFALGRLYENYLNDLEKAKTIYEKIFLNYSGSVFAVEARKRFRILRGDKVQ